MQVPDASQLRRPCSLALPSQGHTWGCMLFVVHYKEVHDEIRVQGVRLRLATG